ncbi:MAG: response regulator transcription factor [Verrucomicrobia bacterium]|nr:MAG: response regulator transcription factor [Verrucomicrobiota bacterium]
MAREQILIIEDDEDIQELIRYNLTQAGYRVTVAGTGEDGIKAARAKKPDLILLDIMLPGMDGLEVCRTLSAQDATRSMPIIILTAKGEEADIVTGLQMGADDYITKPFSPRVLLARVKVVLRRQSRDTDAGEQPLKISDLHIHPGRREVCVKNKPMELTFTEFGILHFLARHPGWVYTREQIVDEVHGEDYPVTDRSIDVQMVNLRRKLGPAGECIETVRGVGYRFKE